MLKRSCRRGPPPVACSFSRRKNVFARPGPEPEVRTPLAASSIANFGFKRDTRIIELLVPLRFRSSYQSVQQGLTNFGIGALVPHLGNGDNSKRRGPGAP